MIEDIEIGVVKGDFGFNVKIYSNEESFKGMGWVESRNFDTELEAKIASIVCESIIKLSGKENLKDVDFSISKWRILTISMFHLLDTPNKNKEF